MKADILRREKSTENILVVFELELAGFILKKTYRLTNVPLSINGGRMSLMVQANCAIMIMISAK